MSNSLWLRGLQHATLPCPSLSSGVCSSTCSLSQWCHPPSHSLCSLLLLPSVFPRISVFSSESTLYQVVKVLELQLQHQSFQRIFRVDFFRIDWFDLLAVQGTLKSLLRYHYLKASTLQHSVFIMAQPEYLFNRN